jgi:O-antigen/teichoic acid export membrane protein
MYLISEELIVLLFSDKWLPSAAYFKILVLGGFAYPVSALLVNILTGRGNSKAFLRLEIYKKILLTVNLFVGFLWGIEGYLYGLAAAGALSVVLNIVFASREIRLPFWALAKPVVTQMAIAAAAVGIVSLLPNENYGILLLFFVKSISFAVVYVVINRVLRTSSYEYFSKEAIQIVSHTMKKG